MYFEALLVHKMHCRLFGAKPLSEQMNDIHKNPLLYAENVEMTKQSTDVC